MHKTVCMTAVMLCIGARASLLPGIEFSASLRSRPDTVAEVSLEGSIAVKCNGGGIWYQIARFSTNINPERRTTK